MKEHSFSGARDGFSLLEVLIALSILAVGLLGLALFQVTAIKGNATANDTMLATNYAQDQVENLQLKPFDNIVSSPNGISGGLPADDNTIKAITDTSQTWMSKKGVRFYRVWSVSNSSANLKMVRVWAYWWDDKDRSHNVQLVTQKGNML